MQRLLLLVLVIACPLVAMGQIPVGTGTESGKAVVAQAPAAAPVNSAAQTAEGAALQGTSQVVSAAGQYNLATSAAAINAAAARHDELRDDVQGVETFWQMRAIGRAEREAERGPRLTAEELALVARAAAPRPLTVEQIDRVSGELRWPGPLLDPDFEEQRVALDECTARWAKYGALDYNDQSQVRENVHSLFAGLKAQINVIPPQDYVASRSFLQSLLYATTHTTF